MILKKNGKENKTVVYETTLLYYYYYYYYLYFFLISCFVFVYNTNLTQKEVSAVTFEFKNRVKKTIIIINK